MSSWCGKVPDSATLKPTTFASKSLLSSTQCYRNIEWEALGIQHALEKFHHYSFAKEVCVITDHKPMVTIINKDVSMLSQHSQCIMLHVHNIGYAFIQAWSQPE